MTRQQHTIIKILVLALCIILFIGIGTTIIYLLSNLDTRAGEGVYCVLAVKDNDTNNKATEQMFEVYDAQKRRYTLPVRDDWENYQSFILLLDDNKTNNKQDDFIIDVYPQKWTVIANE